MLRRETPRVNGGVRQSKWRDVRLDRTRKKETARARGCVCVGGLVAHRVYEPPGLASPVRVHGEGFFVGDEVPDQVELGTISQVEREDERGRGDRPFKARVRVQGESRIPRRGLEPKFERCFFGLPGTAWT